MRHIRHSLFLGFLSAALFGCAAEEDSTAQQNVDMSAPDASVDDVGQNNTDSVDMAQEDSAEADMVDDEMADAEEAPDMDPVNPGGLLEACSDVLEVTSGTLCAIQPSLLDPDTKDIAGTDSPQDRVIGFGHHVIGIPDNPDPTKGLWVHIGGTYGRPYDPDKNAYPSALWIDEIMAQGYLVVQAAYDNRDSINDSCKAPSPGADRDNCAGEARAEVLTGEDLSPYRDTDAANSFDHRLASLLTHIEDQAASLLPDHVDPDALDWSTVTVSGHSQGGNMAYYIARFRGVAFACMLGSPYDVHDTVNPSQPPIADWFREGTPMTPVEALGQVITTEDTNARAFRAAAVFLGLTPGQESFEVSQPPYVNLDGEEINGHAASLAAVALAPIRAQACFR